MKRLLFSALGMILEFSSRFFILHGTNKTKSLIPLVPTAYYIGSKNISMNLEITKASLSFCKMATALVQQQLEPIKKVQGNFLLR